MVKSQPSLDRTFAALADPTRRAILARLASGEASVMELAAPHRMSVPAVFKHLGVLDAAGLIRTEKTGRVRRCALSAEPLRGAAEWIEFYRQFWERQLDYLEQYLTEIADKEPSWERNRKSLSPSSGSAARSARRRRSSSKRGRTRR
jgi:DNA-binding transcriptional ArsR family regulator